MRRLSVPFTLTTLFSLAAGEAPPEPAGPVPGATVVVTTTLDSAPSTTTLQGEDLASRRLGTDDAAQLLDGLPGVSFYSGGGLASLPVLHGLADDRLNLMVDGIRVTASCPNHMNPALSTVDPKAVASVAVFAGVTPVSLGGDSIGGTVLVDTFNPVFAKPGEGIREAGSVATYFRSGNRSTGLALADAISGPGLSLAVNGSLDHANDYHDGSGQTVTSTYYQARNLGLGFAAKGADQLLTVKLGYQSIPRQGFVNEQMDLVGNETLSLVITHRASFAWGTLETRAYGQNTRHEMNVGQDKLTLPMPMIMPMDTHGRDAGYVLKAEVPFAGASLLRLGNEFHAYALDDWWPPVAGAAPAMGPDTFQSIHDGHRNQFGLYAEWEAKWSDRTTTLLGLRNDQIRMDTGKVQGYSSLYGADATTFNGSDHARRDSNWDFTATARFEPSATGAFELGYARKSQSPNLYQRYAWSTAMMTSGMINWFGDGNDYVGNPDLKPEVAQTLSLTADWHDSARSQWGFKATPYYTRVRDYIDVDVIGTTMYGLSTFNQLQFANHGAELYGLDLSGLAGLWQSGRCGRGQVKGTLSWVHGGNTDTGQPLYHMMPLNARLALEQSTTAWTNTLEVQWVGRKSRVDPLRLETETPGYTLVNVRTACHLRDLRLELGVTNLFDRLYDLPLGGVNFDRFMASGWTGPIQPLTGPGRSLNAGVALTF